MSHKDNADLRNTGDGGWFYAEHELFSVFAPMIGSDGVATYMAMCRLIPLAAVDELRPVTMRSVQEASCVSKSTVQRKIGEIVRLGMVEETRTSARRPATYKLVSLRKLAAVGAAQLKARLGVPGGDTELEGRGAGRTAGGAYAAAQHRAGGAIARMEANGVESVAAIAPGGPGGIGVPGWDTEEVEEETVEKSEDLRVFGEGSGKPVSQGRGLVSQKRASVSQGRHLLKEEEERKRSTTPPTPPSGGCEKNLPNQGKDETADQGCWGEFKLLLKSELCSMPGSIVGAKAFTTVQPGQNDYDTCFRDWWLVEVQRKPASVELITVAKNAEACGAGLEKYIARLRRNAAQAFHVPRGHCVTITLRKQEHS